MAIDKYLSALTAVLTISFFCSAESAEPYVPGSHDAEALQFLKQTLEKVTLKKTILKDACPRFHIVNQKELSWPQALHAADEQFGNNRRLRAIFLWKHIPKGSSSKLLKELGLARADPGISTVGMRYLRFGIEPLPKYKQRPPPQGYGARKRWKASLSFSEGNIQKSVLNIVDVGIKGVAFEDLWFGKDNHLVAFSRKSDCKDVKRTMTVRGNLSGEGGTDYYYVIVGEDDRSLEVISYHSDATFMRRSFLYPESEDYDTK